MIIAYYQGAYGPTIRLDAKTAADLLSLCQIFWKLAIEDVVQVDLCQALACQSDGIQSLIVQSVPEYPAKALELKGYGSEGPIFSWANTSEDWKELSEKVDALILVALPGHHYLTHEGVDDALVELCYRE